MVLLFRMYCIKQGLVWWAEQVRIYRDLNGSGYPQALKMHTVSFRKKTCMWLGIASIIAQAFMPIWQANAAGGISRGGVQVDASGFAEICYALAESSGMVGDENAPLNQTRAKGHCLLCQLPSFGNVIADTPPPVPVPFRFAAAQYFSADPQTLTPANRDRRPPTRAPPA